MLIIILIAIIKPIYCELNTFTILQKKFTFENILDNGEYTILIKKLSGDLELIGHPGSSMHIVTNYNVSKNKKKLNIKQEISTSTFKKEVKVDILEERLKNIIIHIPVNTSFRLNSDSGDLNIKNVKGQINISSRYGDIFIENISGHINLTNNAGNIIMENVNGNSSIILKNGKFEMKNSSGFVSTQIEEGSINNSNFKGIIKNSITGGDIRLSLIDSANVKNIIKGGSLFANNIFGSINSNIINGSIDLVNIYGITSIIGNNSEIYFENIKSDLMIRLKSGDINGTDIFGSIDCITNDGSITIEKSFSPSYYTHNINLESKHGDINLIVPENLYFNIDLILKESTNHKNISSYIPLEKIILNNSVIAKSLHKSSGITCSIKSLNGKISIENF